MRRPAAYTLVEVLLVLALLVLAAGLVAPAVLEGGARNELEDAAQKVANMWSRARLDAVTSGQVLIFRCQPGTGMASVAGIDSAVEAGASAGMGAAAVGDQAAVGGAPTQELNLTGITFLQIAVAEPPGSQHAVLDSSASSGACVVLFRPDGATSDAEAVLQHDSGDQIVVTLRGLTGATRVVDVSADQGGP
ncbi:hypothetical protein Pla123a_44370 [Posidoniimonas polymericola]|uniref:General secretion pathway GspH domain-containing protein n=1 Tax=Posidoniimonas polymericola TaxID=2528002 RepID=A0A5C5XWH9_9BACT|nr:hypothetical protein [Posidoniimonas polymericola]TWT67008.1 hypothetical protein Pla123a_44370 [Posidoniimonas polymericola]